MKITRGKIGSGAECKASARSLPTASTLAALLIFGLISASWSAAPGTTTGELMKIPVGARAIGMGEAYTAAADDVAALAWNPAGMSHARQRQASFMHSSLLENVHYEHLGIIIPGDSYSFGGTLGYLGYGDIAGYDDMGQSIGSQSANAMVISGGASAFVYPRLSLGVTGMILRQSLAGESAMTFAANMGALYGFSKRPFGGDYRVGLSVLNLGPGLKFISERDPLPRKIKVGFLASRIKDQPLNLTLDFTAPNDNSKYVSLGSEYWFRDIIGLRLGYTGSNDQGKGLRVGMGLKLRQFTFDYAYGSFGDFGATHRVETAFKWGERIHQLNKEQRSILKEAKGYGAQGDYVQQIMAMNELLEQDPTNDRVLKSMIGAHERMLQSELKDAVAQAETKPDIPSPEEFALQDLVPGQQALAQAAPLAGSGLNGFDPSDPLGLSNLPDAGNYLEPAVAPAPAMVPAPSAPAMLDSAPAEPAAQAAPPSDGVLLNPEDIYGN